MINVVLFEPEIPGNTGNIMRTCVATNARLHLIKPLGFKLDEASIKRAGVNYIDKLEYFVYENYDDFLEKNKDGDFFYFTRYGKKPHDSFNYKEYKNIYLIERGSYGNKIYQQSSKSGGNNSKISFKRGFKGKKERV